MNPFTTTLKLTGSEAEYLRKLVLTERREKTYKEMPDIYKANLAYRLSKADQRASIKKLNAEDKQPRLRVRMFSDGTGVILEGTETTESYAGSIEEHRIQFTDKNGNHSYEILDVLNTHDGNYWINKCYAK